MKALFTLASLLLAASLAGCLDNESPGLEAAPLYGPGSGSQEEHGAPTVDEGEIDVSLSGVLWTASQDIIIRNDFGGASLSKIQASTDNGRIHMLASEGGDYRVVVELRTWGLTPDDAEGAIEAVAIEHADDLVDGVLHLSTRIEFDDAAPLFPLDPNRGGRADVTFYVPATPGYDLQLATSNGNIEVVDLQGPRAAADSSNGAISLAGLVMDSLSAATGNGDIFLDAVADMVTVAAANGDVRASLSSLTSGSYALATGNGDVILAVNGTQQFGYDVRANTANGEVIVELEDAVDVDPASEDYRHVRTVDFDGRQIQINADLATSNGDLVITDDEVAPAERPHH